VNGVTLNYLRTDVRNPPVVFVHGSLNDYRSWNQQVPFFARRFTTITYSRRNHYPNPWSDYPTDYNLETEETDLVSLIEALHLDEPVHLVGASYGAFASLILANKAPHVVRSLVLEEPPILSVLPSEGRGMGAIIRESEYRFERLVLAPLRIGDLESAAKGFIDSLEGNGAYDSLPRATKAMMLQNDRTLEKELPTKERDPFSVEQMRETSVPTLLVRGADSARMYQEITRILSESLPHVQTAIIPHSSHAVHQQNPEIFNQTVSKFLLSNT
jgi:non-heme chloroperoxidase